MKPRGTGLAIYAAGAFLFLHLPLLILSIFSFNSSRMYSEIFIHLQVSLRG